jgi:hypothetical protein
MTISQATHELLKAHAGRGFSSDPALLARHKVRLAQNTSKLPKHGQGQPGLWILPDAAATCTSKLRVIAGAVYSILVERTTSDKWVDEHHILPPDAEKNGYGWRLPNKNVIDKEARLVGVFGGVDAELDLAKTAMKVARAFNSDAKARATRLNVPIFGLAYEFGSQELVNDRGQPYFGPTFEFIGAVGEPEGPSEEEIIRASALHDLVESTIAAAKREAEGRTSAILPPRSIAPKPLITSGAPALRAVKAPTAGESYAGADDDIPF